MTRMTRRSAIVFSALLLIVASAAAQTKRHKETLSVKGYPGQANVIQVDGRTYVDVQELARITQSSISFQDSRIVFTLAPGDAAQSADSSDQGFSPGFRRAAIQAMAAIREWGGTLAVTVQNGYPVANSLAGNTIAATQARAAEAVALASTAAFTDTDRRALVLLNNELTLLQSWSENFVEARKSMRAVNLTMSENALQNDEDAQKAIRCAQSLTQMFATGTYQDEASCH